MQTNALLVDRGVVFLILIGCLNMPKNDKSSVEMSDRKQVQPFLVRCHIDLPLLLGLLMTLGMSLFVLYSASGQHVEMLERHCTY